MQKNRGQNISLSSDMNTSYYRKTQCPQGNEEYFHFCIVIMELVCENFDELVVLFISNILSSPTTQDSIQNNMKKYISEK